LPLVVSGVLELVRLFPEQCLEIKQKEYFFSKFSRYIAIYVDFGCDCHVLDPIGPFLFSGRSSVREITNYYNYKTTK
jgi:hypothetical protein